MPLTLGQIIEETRRWPPEKVGELVGRLTEELHTSDPEIEAAWKQETRRRLAEIENGTVQPSLPASAKSLAGETARVPTRGRGGIRQRSGV